MSLVTPEVVRTVAYLARLSIEGDALKKFAADLDEILSYVKQLETMPTDGIEPTSHVLPLSNVLREDSPKPSLNQDVVINLAPGKSPPFIAVPKVIESER